jgi:hypothetical protein
MKPYFYPPYMPSWHGQGRFYHFYLHITLIKVWLSLTASRNPWHSQLIGIKSWTFLVPVAKSTKNLQTLFFGLKQVRPSLYQLICEFYLNLSRNLSWKSDRSRTDIICVKGVIFFYKNAQNRWYNLKITVSSVVLYCHASWQLALSLPN